MKKKGILLYIILLISYILSPINSVAQEKKIISGPNKVKESLLKGIEIGVDVGGYAAEVFGSDYTNISASITANLKNRYMPVVEIGYGKIDILSEDNSIKYNTKAPFFKLGADYNFFYKKPYLPGYLFGGIRFAHSSYTYNVSAPAMTDPTWGNINIPFSYSDVKGNTTWSELVVGIKANIFKNFHMGWSARYRIMLSNKTTENSEPLYTPGYGMSNSSKFGFTYDLIFYIPFHR